MSIDEEDDVDDADADEVDDDDDVCTRMAVKFNASQLFCLNELQ